MDKHIVVQTWLWRGIEHFYLGFMVEEWRWRRYEPFFDYLGLELFCKAYLLAERSSEYKRLDFQKAKHKIDKIARSLRHGLGEMLKEIDRLIGGNKISKLINADYDGYAGKRIVIVLEAAYFESRYPMPESISKKFPIKGTNLCWYPLLSSGLSKFAYAVGRELLYVLKSKDSIGIPKAEIEKAILVSDIGERFCRSFFQGNIEKYVI